MNLEVGKKYNTRNGNGTVEILSGGGEVFVGRYTTEQGVVGGTWRNNGMYYWNGKQHSKDLVSEIQEQSYIGMYPFGP